MMMANYTALQNQICLLFYNVELVYIWEEGIDLETKGTHLACLCHYVGTDNY